MGDDEVQRRVQSLELQFAKIQDDIAIAKRKDEYTMATLGKRNLGHNITMDLQFARNLAWNSAFEMGAPDSGGGGSSGGAIPTLLVASSTASAKIKAAADYICDGVDDQVEIIAAITTANAGRVFLTEGTFQLTAPIVATPFASCHQLMGIGRQTILEAQVAMPSVIGTGDAQIMNIRDIQIVGNFIAETGIDYRNNSAAVPLFENVEVGYCNGDAFKLYDVADGSGRYGILINCLAHDNGGSGFVLGHYVRAYACEAASNNVDGFHCLGDHISIHDCEAISNTVAGFHAFVTQYLVIDGCRCGSNLHGIYLNQDGRSQIVNNTMRGNQQHGIYLLGTNSGRVANNYVLHSGTQTHNTYDNIRLTSAQLVAVTGNTCAALGDAGLNRPRYGIYVDAGSIGNWVANNYCRSGGVTGGIGNAGTATNLNPGNILLDGTWSNTTG